MSERVRAEGEPYRLRGRRTSPRRWNHRALPAAISAAADGGLHAALCARLARRQGPGLTGGQFGRTAWCRLSPQRRESPIDRLQSGGAVRVGLPARLRPRGRAAVHVRRPRGGRARERSCRCRSGAPRVRGVVVGIEDAPPPGSRPSPAGARARRAAAGARRSGALARRATTARRPARALELVAPPRRARRGERRPAPAGLPGEAAARAADGRAGVRDRADRRGDGRGRGALPPLRRDRKRQDRGLPAGVLGGAGARPRRDRARPGDRPHAPGGRPLPRPLRRPDRPAPLGPDRGGASGRARADRVRRGADRGRRALGGLRSRARPRADLRRRGARRLLQAGVRSALRRAHGRREARRARGRRRALRQRDAAAGELGGARAARARRPARPASSRRSASSTSAASAATRCRRRCWPSSGRSRSAAARRSCCSTAAGWRPAIHCRTCGVTRRCPNCDVALVLHADGGLRCHHCGHAEPAPELCPECGSAELARLGAGTQRLERELAARVPELELDQARRGHARPEPPPSSGSPPPTARCCSGRRWSPRGTTSTVSRSPRSSTPTPGMALPDFRAEERTFQLAHPARGPQRPRRARDSVLIQTFQPDARPVELAARHDVERFLAGELERRRALGYPPARHLVRILVSGREPEAPMRALEELKAAIGDCGAARARAGPPAARPPPGAARRQDRPARRPRRPRGAGAGGGRARDAQGRPGGRRRRRSAEPLNTLTAWPRATEHGQVVDEELDAEREARRRLALAQIRQWPDPVLRLRARGGDGLRRRPAAAGRADEGADAWTRTASASPRTRPASCGGSSSSAPATRSELVAAVNPRIVAPSDERATDDEGCLSLQRVLVPVERHASVTLEAPGRRGGRRSASSSRGSTPASSSTSSTTSTAC